jgi:hypothetical protein
MIKRSIPYIMDLPVIARDIKLADYDDNFEL